MPIDLPPNASTPAVLQLESANTKGSFGFAKDVDWFKLNLKKGGYYAVQLAVTGIPFDSPPDRIEVRGPQGKVLKSDLTSDRDGVGEAGFSFRSKAPGVHYVAVAKGPGGKTPIDYEVRISADLPADISTTGTLSLGQEVKGGFFYCGDADWRRIKLAKGKAYDLTLQAAGADPVISVHDQTGKRLDSALDQDEATLAAFKAPYTGTFFVGAGNAGDCQPIYRIVVTRK